MITASLVKELREVSGAGMLDCKKALEETSGNLEAAIDYLREKGISKAAKKSDRIAAEGISAILEAGNKAVIIEVNSETDFVAKNEEFLGLVNTILTTLINSDVKTVEEALLLPSEEGTLNDLIISKTAKIGEKLDLRRFEILEKSETESFGSYIHMGGRIAVLTLIEGTDSSVAKDVSMHSAAMKPQYVRRDQVPTDVIEHEKGILREQMINEGKAENMIDKIVEGKINKFFEEVCLENQKFVKDSDLTVLQFVSNNNSKIKEMIRYEVGEGIERKSCDFAAEVAEQLKK